MANPKDAYSLNLHDYSDELEGSEVLEGEPGDILYVPFSYWHIGEDPARELTLSLHHFLNRKGDLRRYFPEATFGERSPGGTSFSMCVSNNGRLPEPIADFHKSLSKNFALEEKRALKEFAMQSWMKKRSALGFSMLPSIQAPSRTQSGRFRNETGVPILYFDGVIAAAGRTWKVPKSACWKDVTCKMNSGESFLKDDLERLLHGSKRKSGQGAALDLSQSFELFFNELVAAHGISNIPEERASVLEESNHTSCGSKDSFLAR